MCEPGTFDRFLWPQIDIPQIPHTSPETHGTHTYSQQHHVQKHLLRQRQGGWLFCKGKKVDWNRCQQKMFYPAEFVANSEIEKLREFD